MQAIQLEKRKLRVELQNCRDKMPPCVRQNLSRKICGSVEQLIDSHQPKSILFYLHMKSEVETCWSLEPQLASGRLIVLPKIEGKKLSLYQIKNLQTEVQFHKWGMREPDPIYCSPINSNLLDLILVPGCGFDKFGYRLGYGGGYYDRLLSNYPKALIVGLAFSSQIVESLPVQSWDYPVDFVLTENGVAN